MTSPDDAKRIEEIRERAGKATRGPWWREQVPIHQVETYEYRPQLIKYRWDDVPTWIAESADRDEQSVIDFDFIAHARSDIPWLLDQLAAASVEIARLQGSVEALADAGDGAALALQTALGLPDDRYCTLGERALYLDALVPKVVAEIALARKTGQAEMSAALERGCNGEPGGWPDWVYALRRQLDQRWISVEERTPRPGVYLVTLPPSHQDRVAIGTYQAAGYWTWMTGEGEDFIGPTHWMPLPAPPADAEGKPQQPATPESGA